LYYWYLLVGISILAIFYKLLDLTNLSFKKFKIEDISSIPGDLYTITYKIEGNFPELKPGQYYYIKNSFFSEAHPFSLLDYDEENKTITFGIKALGKFTQELKNTKINDFHYLDGPFGEFTFESQNEEPKVILAGGIGITPFYKLVKEFGNEDTYLLYANFKLDYALFRNKFKELLKNNYFDFISNEKIQGKNIVCEVISTNKIKELISKYDKNSINFLICGSPGFTKGMLNCLNELEVSKEKIFIEEFEY
jgi:predicted ferric reductase